MRIREVWEGIRTDLRGRRWALWAVTFASAGHRFKAQVRTDTSRATTASETSLFESEWKNDV